MRVRVRNLLLHVGGERNLLLHAGEVEEFTVTLQVRLRNLLLNTGEGEEFTVTCG